MQHLKIPKMSCDYAVLNNVTIAVHKVTNNSITTPLNTTGYDTAVYTGVIYKIVIPSVFIFGIIGNAINLYVLSQRHVKQKLEQMEQSATLGLVSLALSDLLFCIVGFPMIFLSAYRPGSGSKALDAFRFHYEIYKRPLLNIFLFSSTWLITVISSERFVGVCFPYRACTMIKVRRTIMTHLLVFVVSIIINLPLFFEFRIVQEPCYSTCLCYMMQPSWFAFQPALAYRIIWLTLGTFIPLFILLFCNASILKSIYNLRHSSGPRTSRDQHLAMTRLTWILLAIVVLFIVMVCPSMILEMVHKYSFFENIAHLTLAVAITNLMQAVKFSSNFLLYCGLHVRFRKILTCKIPTRIRNGKRDCESGVNMQNLLIEQNRQQLLDRDNNISAEPMFVV